MLHRHLVLAPALAVGLFVSAAQAQGADALSSCLQSMRAQAPAQGVSVADFDRYTANVSLLESTVKAAKSQPEHRDTWWEYIAKTVDQERVDDGMRVLNENADALARIQSAYGVEEHALVAIFGVETNFGRQLGKTDVLNAWVTRACTESNRLWKANVYAAIKLLRDDVVQPEQFVGSWSGAFGMTQFIPTSFYELAADGDGDGRIDLYGSLPDALASTASHLKKRGVQWASGVPPVIEVRLPDALSTRLPASPGEATLADDRRSLAQWVQAGVRAADGSALADTAPQAQAYLFAPTGRSGPVFLATRNFDAILHYNRSPRYALSVSLLVNRLSGAHGLTTPWPTDDPGLSRAEIRELQQRLLDRGHDVGVADGIPGQRTRDAVEAEQAILGLKVDGRPGMKVLQALRNTAG